MDFRELFGMFGSDEEMEEKQLVTVGAFLDEHYEPSNSDEETQPCMDVFDGLDVLEERKLEEFLKTDGVTFSARLMQFTAEKCISVPELCRRSGIDRKHFSKMKNNPNYRPTKNTVIALSAGLRLSLEETECFLKCAGYALSKSSKADLIVEYCLRNGIYDIDRINDLLFKYNETLLRE